MQPFGVGAGAKSNVTQRQNELHKKILAALIKQEENRICADCTARGPTWASINLGVFICLNCSGIHRNLGVHISKVRSTNLDTWLPEQVEFIKATGNVKANAYWECNMPAGYPKPQEQADMASRKQFIEAKYVHKKFAAAGEPPSIEAYVANLAASPPPPPAPAPVPTPAVQEAAAAPSHSHSKSQASIAPQPPPMTDLLNLGGDDDFEDFKGVSHQSTASSAHASMAGTSVSGFQLDEDDWSDFANASRPTSTAPAQKDPFADLLGFGTAGPAEDPLASLMSSLTVTSSSTPAPSATGAGFETSAFTPAAVGGAPPGTKEPFANLLGV